jgi:hypothetical protein
MKNLLTRRELQRPLTPLEVDINFEKIEEAIANPQIALSNSLNVATQGLALDATQGRILNDKITSINNHIGNCADFIIVDHILLPDYNVPNPVSAGEIMLQMEHDGDPKTVLRVARSYFDTTNGVISWDYDYIAHSSLIPSTTIFVYPGTFARYRCVDGVLIESDDQDGIVPKWLEWRAVFFSTGNGDGFKVLNSDDRNFINIKTHINYGDVYTIFSNSSIFPLGSTNNFGGLSNAAGSITWGNTPSNGGNFEIKHRLRGAPPKPISAKTVYHMSGTHGIGIEVTFDSNISEVGKIDGSYFWIQINGQNSAYPVSITSSIITFSDNTISIPIEDYISYGDSISLGYYYDESGANYPYISSIESDSCGILQSFFIGVDNTTQAPPYVYGASTNEDGTQIILDMSEDVANCITNGNYDMFYVSGSNSFYTSTFSFSGHYIYIELPMALSSVDLVEVSLVEGAGIFGANGGVLSYFANYPVTNIINN